MNDAQRAEALTLADIAEGYASLFRRLRDAVVAVGYGWTDSAHGRMAEEMDGFQRRLRNLENL